jgi:hypothetical protein
MTIITEIWASMAHRFFLIILIFVCFFSCKTVHKTEKESNIHEQIQYVIEKSGFIKLPLEFDANIETDLKSTYSVNRNSNDTLLFENGIFDIIGFLPDTMNYYAFLYFSIGDMLTPTIRTMDKNWRKIDEKFISIGACAGYVELDVTSCYDSVCIYKDLKIKSVSKVVGTVEIDEDSTSQILDICNMRVLEGFIDKYGKINHKKSGIIDCNK